ncbi:MAG: DNA-3-methyladenine glycosylase 2 family protein [Rhodobacteraceae bacterium]|nr:DNA-3-methyladenine glycosylase 2 family protein [Paracoccaceae bacterium]
MTDRILKTTDCLSEGAAWLVAREPRFALAVPATGLSWRQSEQGFNALLGAIVSQQVSVASARAIWARLEAAGMCDPAQLSIASDEDLRAIGLSRQKARYGRELARAGIDFDRLNRLSTEELIETLIVVPGIGRWTAEIYAIFALSRADVFAPGDFALREAARILFDLPERPSERVLRTMAMDWSPWRSVAAHLLWAYYKTIKLLEGI